MSEENEKEQFSPELVDDQVDSFLQDNPMQSLESRLSHELQASYTQDARSLANVWERLELANKVGASEQRRAPTLRKPAARQKRLRLERIFPMQIVREKTKQKGPVKRALMVSAAVLVALVIVGSVLWTVGINRGTKVGTPPNTINVQPTKQPSPSNSAVYVGGSYGLTRANALTGKVVWSYQIPTDTNLYEQTSVSRILVTDNVIYGLVQGFSAPSRVMAFNATNGHVLWSTNVPEATDMALNQGTLYVAASPVDIQTNKSSIFTLNASTGKDLTQKYTIDGVFPDLSLVAGTLYVSTNSNLVAIDTIRGQQIWQKSFTDLGFSEANAITIGFSIAGGNLYATYEDGTSFYCFALNASNGGLLWKTKPLTVTAIGSGGGAGISAPVANDTTVYFALAGKAGAVFAYDAQKGKQLWSQSTGSSLVQRTPTLSAGNLYIAEDIIGTSSPRTSLVALNATTGKIAWSSSIQTGVGVSASVLNGVVYMAAANQQDTDAVYALNSSDGKALWQARLGNSPAILVTAN